MSYKILVPITISQEKKSLKKTQKQKWGRSSKFFSWNKSSSRFPTRHHSLQKNIKKINTQYSWRVIFAMMTHCHGRRYKFQLENWKTNKTHIPSFRRIFLPRHYNWRLHDRQWSAPLLGHLTSIVTAPPVFCEPKTWHDRFHWRLLWREICEPPTRCSCKKMHVQCWVRFFCWNDFIRYLGTFHANWKNNKDWIVELSRIDKILTCPNPIEMKRHL